MAPVSSTAPSKSAMDDYKDLKPVVDEDPVKTVFVTILRVQEATLQVCRATVASLHRLCVHARKNGPTHVCTMVISC